MLSWLPKLPLNEAKRKGSRENLEDALNDQLTAPKQADNIYGSQTPSISCPQTPNVSCPQTPRTPRLERSSNHRRHLNLDLSEMASNRLVSGFSSSLGSGFSSASESSTQTESMPSPISEPVSPMHIPKFEPSLHPHLESSPEPTWFQYMESPPHPSQSHDAGQASNVHIESCVSGGSSSLKWMEEDGSGIAWSDSADNDTNLRAQERSNENISGHTQANYPNESSSSAINGSMKAGQRGKMGVNPSQIDSGTSIISPATNIKKETRKSKKNMQKCQNQYSYNWTPLQSSSSSSLSSPVVRSGYISPHSPMVSDNSLQYESRPCPLPLPPPPKMVSQSYRSCEYQSYRSDIHMTTASEGSSTTQSRAASPLSSRTNKSSSSGTTWVKGKLLGSGSFGKVYRGHNSVTGEMCAIKEVEIVSDDPRSRERARQLNQEINLLSVLRHPNILHYRGSEMVGDSLYIYLELVSGGSIYRLLQEFDTFSESVVRRYTRQILFGLQYLHDQNTVHRDIKCANILVDEDGKIKLADFGTAKIIGEEFSPLSFKGSPYWMAPELITQEKQGHELAVDIWSLGCTVIEMATGKPPWHQYDGIQAMFKVLRADDIPIPESLSAEAQDFVCLCLQRDPAKRPTARELLRHPFVQVDTYYDKQLQPATPSKVPLSAHNYPLDYRSPIDNTRLSSNDTVYGLSCSTPSSPHSRLTHSVPVSPRPMQTYNNPISSHIPRQLPSSVQRRRRLTNKRRNI